jgi:hypothetical protein
LEGLLVVIRKIEGKIRRGIGRVKGGVAGPRHKFSMGSEKVGGNIQAEHTPEDYGPKYQYCWQLHWLALHLFLENNRFGLHKTSVPFCLRTKTGKKKRGGIDTLNEKSHLVQLRALTSSDSKNR